MEHFGVYDARAWFVARFEEVVRVKTNLKGYDVSIVAHRGNLDSFTATTMFLRELAITFLEAARQNRKEGFAFAADKLMDDAKKLLEAVEILEMK